MLNQANGDIAADNRQSSQYIEEMQLELLWALFGQVAATGNALAGLLLEDWPTKKSLEGSVSNIYKQIGMIDRLAGILLITNGPLAGTLCESSRAKLENLCREAIETAGKSGGEK